MNQRDPMTVRLWRQNVHVEPTSPGRDVVDILAIAALAGLWLVIVILIFT